MTGKQVYYYGLGSPLIATSQTWRWRITSLPLQKRSGTPGKYSELGVNRPQSDFKAGKPLTACEESGNRQASDAGASATTFHAY